MQADVWKAQVRPMPRHICPACGAEIISSRATYCDAACKQLAYRNRRRSVTTGNEPASNSNDLRYAKLISDLMHEIERHAQRGGTAYGCAVVVKRVAASHGLDYRGALPRPTRAEREDLDWKHYN